MKDKYYTPEIEEFCYGFEYEYLPSKELWLLESSGNEWIKETFYASCGQDEESEIHEIETLIDKEKIRVKYLDREDCLELGLKHCPHYSKGVGFEHESGYQVVLSDKPGYVDIVDYVSRPIDTFNVKNKSGLKQLLKFLTED